MLIASGAVQRFGVEEADAAVRFGEGPKTAMGAAGRRQLVLDNKPAFELSYWCGTCPVLFERMEGAVRALSFDDIRERLERGISGIDADVVKTFASVLPNANYLPMLLGIEPRLVTPATQGDYFAHEQVATWGLDGFWGLPHYPRTPYYRTFETKVTAGEHLYEFVVPMVPPAWNEQTRVQHYVDSGGEMATAVALSTLDIGAPATDLQTTDYYQHWGLMHFLLDGHHKMQAAAVSARPIQLLSLVAVDGSLALPEQVASLPSIRRQRPSTRVK